MRGLFRSKERNFQPNEDTAAALDDTAPTTTTANSNKIKNPNSTPGVAIPKAWQPRVQRRLKEIAQVQEQEKLFLDHDHDDDDSIHDNQGDDGTNHALLQPNPSGGGGGGGDDDDDHDESSCASLDHNDNDKNKSVIPINRRSLAEHVMVNHVAALESARLLQSIGSDLSDSDTAYFEEEEDAASLFSDSSPQRRHQTTSNSNNTNSNSTSSFKRANTTPRHRPFPMTSLLGTQIYPFSYPSNSSPRIGPVTMPPPSPEPIHSQNVNTSSLVSTTNTSNNSKTPWYQTILQGMLWIILVVCFVGQVWFFPTQWMVWSATALSMYCATRCSCPTGQIMSPGQSTQALQWRRQELLAQGLPYKSRLFVARNQQAQLKKRIKILQRLQKLQKDFLRAKQQEALLNTVQVLFKSNKSPATMHLNALTMSILPVKLKTIGVNVQMPPLLALAQSKRGSHYILYHLFRELLADESHMFQYPPLLPAAGKNQNKKRGEQEEKEEEDANNKPSNLTKTNALHTAFLKKSILPRKSGPRVTDI